MTLRSCRLMRQVTAPYSWGVGRGSMCLAALVHHCYTSEALGIGLVIANNHLQITAT